MTVGATTTVTHFAYDLWNTARSSQVGTENSDVWGEFTASSLTTRYLYSDRVDQQVGRIDVGGSTATYWTLEDRLNSVRDVIDNGGIVKDSLRYDGFGNIDPATETNPLYRGWYVWTGRELDVETGLQYNHARWYDGTTGRWVSQDPLGFDAGDSNLYRYVNNKPTGATDPSGLDELVIENGGIGRRIYWKVTRPFEWSRPFQSREVDKIPIGYMQNKNDIGPIDSFVRIDKDFGGFNINVDELSRLIAGTQGSAPTLWGSKKTLAEMSTTADREYEIRNMIWQHMFNKRWALEKAQENAEKKAIEDYLRTRHGELTASPGTPEWWRQRNELLKAAGYSALYRDLDAMFLPHSNSRFDTFIEMAPGFAAKGMANQANANLNAVVRGAMQPQNAPLTHTNPIRPSVIQPQNPVSSQTGLTGGQANASIGGGVNPPARISLPNVQVTRQPTSNTCVAASLDMMLEATVPGRNSTVTTGNNLRPGGLNASDMVAFVTNNLTAVGMNMHRGTLPEAITSGRPFIAVINSPTGGHAVFVRGTQVRDGTTYLEIHDPLTGTASLVTPTEFDAQVAGPPIISIPTIWGTPIVR